MDTLDTFPSLNTKQNNLSPMQKTQSGKQYVLISKAVVPPNLMMALPPVKPRDFKFVFSKAVFPSIYNMDYR